MKKFLGAITICFVIFVIIIGIFLKNTQSQRPNYENISNTKQVQLQKPLKDISESIAHKPMIKGRSAILVDASAGKILFKQDADIAFPIASMSKMMTEYIVQEAVHENRLQWDEIVVITNNANDMDPRGVKIDIEPKDELTVQDLYNAMVIYSANNAAKALAEHIAGTEADFAKLMNKKAKSLGMSAKSQFVNATGLANDDGSENQMTASDVAILAYGLLRDFPEVVETTKLTKYKLEFNGAVLKNSNAMLFPENKELYLQQVDGLKTGFTDAAGYCFTGTAKQGKHRLISVVMGEESSDARFKETAKLLKFGFANIKK